jgi:hypothetical protein
MSMDKVGKTGTEGSFDPLDILHGSCEAPIDECSARTEQCSVDAYDVPARQCIDGETFGRMRKDLVGVVLPRPEDKLRVEPIGDPTVERSRCVCPEHGSFEPTCVLYSCPLQARCPVCGGLCEVEGSGVKVLTEEESRRKRPRLWAVTDEAKTPTLGESSGVGD